MRTGPRVIVRRSRRDDDAVLFPDVSLPWEEAHWLVSAVKHGGEGNPQQMAASTMDQPGAVNGSFQLMISSLRTLARVPGLPTKTAGAWAQQLHDLLATGAGVDDH